MKDDESGESWMKAEYGEELNNDIFDLNQLMRQKFQMVKEKHQERPNPVMRQ